MLQSSKLSNRFKKVEKKEIKIPAKLSFPHKKLSDNNSTELENYNKTVVETSPLIEDDIKQALIEKIDAIPVWTDYSEEKQKELINSFVDKKLFDENFSMQAEDKQKLIDELYSTISGLGPLDYLVAQENVEAIFVNGTNSVHIEIDGKILNTEMALNEKQLGCVVGNISKLSKVIINESKNIWNVRIDNLLISLVMPKISISGVNIFIRKLKNADRDFIIDSSMMSKEVFDFLLYIIDEKKNIVLSGDINSGKTTLLEALINSAINDKRTVLLEDSHCIAYNSSLIMAYSASFKDADFELLLSNVLKIEPEYIISDLNTPITEITDRKGVVSTLRACSVDAAFTKLVNSFAKYGNLSEKLAKTAVLNNYDYIIQINKLENGKRLVTSIVELTPARTAALSVRTVSKLVNGKYVNDFPQPLTSILADSLIAQSGSMSSRFYNQN